MDRYIHTYRAADTKTYTQTIPHRGRQPTLTNMSMSGSKRYAMTRMTRSQSDMPTPTASTVLNKMSLLHFK